MEKEKRNILALGFTSFFNDISSEAIYSALPLYIEDTAMVGLVGGLFNGLGSVFKFLFGYLSDRLGKRKLLVFCGYALSALSKFLIALSQGFLMLAGIIGDRIGKGIRTSPRDAILAEAKKRGYAFGLHRAMDTLGAISGSLFIFLLLTCKWDIRRAMILAAIIGSLSLVPLSLVEEPKLPVKRRRGRIRITGNMKKFLAGAFFAGLASISPMLLIKQSSVVVGVKSLLIYSVYNIFYVLSAHRLGSLSDLVGRRRVLLLSSITLSLAFFLASLGGGILLFSFPLYGISMGGLLSTAPAEVGDLEKKAKGTALGIFHMIYGIGVFTGSLLLGMLLKLFGNPALIVPAFSAIISTIFFLQIR